MCKKTISILLAFVMIVTMLPMTVFAATKPIISVVDVSAEVGGSVDVQVNMSDSVEFGYMYLEFPYDKNAFEFQSATLSSEASTALSIMESKADVSSAGGNVGKNIVVVKIEPITTGTGITLSDGTFLTLKFNVLDGASGSYSITPNALDSDNENIGDAVTPMYNVVDVTFTSGSITVKSVVADGYTAALSSSTANNEVVSEGNITMNVAVSHKADTYFNAGEISLNYDVTKLTPDTTALDAMVTNGTLSGYKNVNGQLTIADFGADKNLPYTYSIPFTAASVDTETTTSVTLSGAAFILKENADKKDLEGATKTPDTLSVTIKVAMVNVTLTNSENSEETATIEVQKGQEYTFAPDDTANYTYSDVAATVNGQVVEIKDNGNGTFTIAGADITGDVAITYKKVANSYDVTTNTNDQDGNTITTITDPNGATYGEDYEFIIPADKAAGIDGGYTYVLDSVTINGTNYTGYTAEGKNYTIPGDDITGDIVITIIKTEVPANTFTITIDGDGAGNAVIDNENNQVAKDGTASITVTPEAGYNYAVTAKMGDADATVVTNGNTYSVEKVTANVVFTVTKTLDTATVKVYDYVAIDEVGSAWLVIYDGELASGKVPTYNGEAMYWSEKYDAYCWLVIADDLKVDGAKLLVNAKTGTATNVDYAMDINGTTTTDAADAQLVWNMYNSLYKDFITVDMGKFLAADQNANSTDDSTWKLTVEDAQVIISAILNGTATN